VSLLGEPPEPVSSAQPEPFGQGKNPLKNLPKTSSKALEKDRWNKRISGGEKPFNSMLKSS
jgi:hypothetical protein